MRTTLDLPDDLFRRLKAHAALRGTTLRELFLELTTRELLAHGLTGRESNDNVEADARPTPMGRRHTDFVD